MFIKMAPILLLTLLLAVKITNTEEADVNYSIKDILLKINELKRGNSQWNRFEHDPEVDMNATQLITSKGFPCENHYVTTQDGYILNLQRIPHGRKENNRDSSRPVVILQHGLLADSTCYLSNLVNESLAFVLADAGADVWLGNSRGNIYSTNHTTLDPKKLQFWQFSWDEQAKFDLPAMVDYITRLTGEEKVHYVGHSQGTVMGFAAFSKYPELASKINHFIALAPIGRVGHAKGPITLLAPFANSIDIFLDIFGHGSLRAPPELIRVLAADLCQKWGDTLCENILFVLCGFDYNSFNKSRIPVYISHNPSGTSAMNLLHWAQEVLSGEFQMFDWGSPEKNREHYGQDKPPLYDPSHVTVPTAIFRGDQDWLADPTDVGWLMSKLPNIALDKYIPHYNHLDFIWAVDAPYYVNKDILKIIFP